MEEYVLVSLFDGYSGAYEAAKRVKSLKISKCYASEIDKHAIKISKKNHPEIIHLGDVRDLVYSFDVPESTEKDVILIGGSPCQDLSIAGKRAGLKGERSGLFFEYVRALEELKPKYFIFENVASMKNSDRDTISNILGVEPIMIDSALVSAQRRRRYYWTNIKGVWEPKDRRVLLGDVLENINNAVYYLTNQKANTLRARCNNETTTEKGVKRVLEKRIGNLVFIKENGPEYLKAHSYKFGKNYLQYDINGTRHGSQDQRAYYLDGKNPTLDTSCKNKILIDKEKLVIRKLTPVECERLQTLPDGYTEGVSDTQRYKMLGNGFTVDVIAHILSFIPIQDLL